MRNPERLVTLETIENTEANIKPLAKAVNEFGVKTFSSCEGHVEGMRKMRHPWISFHPGEIDVDRFEEFGVMIGTWNVGHPSECWEIETIEYDYPEDRSTDFLYLLCPVEKNFKKDPEILMRMHNQVRELACFLSLKSNTSD